MLLRVLFICLLFLASCQKYAVVVHQQKMDISYLASTAVGSPDPRAALPINGKMMVAEWWVPRHVLDLNPVLRLSFVFRDFSEICVEFPVTKKVGYETYCIWDKDVECTGGVLTYKAEIITCDGEVFRSWKHQLWFKLITIDEESCTDLTRSDIVEKSRQGSVIDTPLCKSLN